MPSSTIARQRKPTYGTVTKCWIVKSGVRFDVSRKQAFDFVNKERGTIQVNGEEIVQSGQDLFFMELGDGNLAIRNGVDDGIVFVLTGAAVDAGLQVMSFHRVLNERQKTIGITGELAATKIPLSSNNVLYAVNEWDGNGKFGKGKLDIPLTEVGGSARFQVPCPHGVRLLLILSVVDSRSPEKTDRQAAEAENKPHHSVEQWYYAKGKQRLGPFTTEQMRQLASAGAIQPTDMVLKAGAKQWVQASSVGEFVFPTPAASVPPLTAKRWYYAREGKAFGPVTVKELRRLVASGQLQPTDFLCRQGTQTWVSVKSVQPL